MMQSVVIIGGKESGVGAGLLAKKLGYNVLISDGKTIVSPFREEMIDNDIRFEENGHSSGMENRFDMMILSPGVPSSIELVRTFKSSGKEVISEIEFAWRHIGGSKLIGITGSNGKTTLTSLIWHILNENKLDARLVGNIGYSFARIVATDPGEWYVCELSSFQLEEITTLKPDVAIITNITADHLDRYQYDMSLYAAAKFRITLNQSPDNTLILNGSDPATIEYFQTVTTQAGLIWYEDAMIESGIYQSQAGTSYDLNNTPLKGRHNQANMAMAIEGCQNIGLQKDQIFKGIMTFESLAHRLEPVETIGGVEYINDSKATNVDAVWFALDAMSKSVIWIAGGTDKGNDYNSLMPLVRSKVKYMICLGIDNQALINAFGAVVPGYKEVRSAEDAVKLAASLAESGDVVLLSPACASFDLFKNYEDRGDQFKMAVRNLL